MRRCLLLLRLPALIACETSSTPATTPDTAPDTVSAPDSATPPDKVGYFPWLRDTSFGVHESTGSRDFQLWWTSISYLQREGDTVVFGINDGSQGGHNLMTRTAKLLASNIAGYLLTGDEAMREVAEQYCKGVSSTILGMVHDEDDPVPHLMARNVVPMDHSYTLADGREAAVDYSGWRSEYDNWNCSRFPYMDNPTWGEVWVTNMRSKDDVSRLLRAAAYMEYAAELAPDEEVRAACAEARELVGAFSRDVVDSDYCIRTKDAGGNVFCPGSEDDPVEGRSAERGDLGSYIQWEGIIPNAECNGKRAHALVGYGDPRGNDCGLASGNAYEELAITTHYFNAQIIRSYHLSNTMQSLVRRADGAEDLVQGLLDRYNEAQAKDPAQYGKLQDEWDRDVATGLMQAAGVGRPTSWDEARLIYTYMNRAIDRYLAWPYWDPWSDELEDGSYPHHPDDIDRGGDGDEDDIRWIRPEDMATALEVCWSPFRNPDGAAFLDCDLIADPSRWDPSWAE